jgi:outer membrane lipoprotein-sorting protein
MNQAPWEKKLEHCYTAFDEQHAELRADLTAKLGAVASSTVVGRADRPLPRKSVWRRSVAIAVCVLVGAFVLMTLPFGGTRPLYGLEDLPNRLVAARSIYVHAISYQTGKTAKGEETLSAQQEWYVERPNRYRVTSIGWSQMTARRLHTASDGAHRILIDDDAKTVLEGNEVPLASEYTVASLIQGSLIQQLLGGPSSAGFRKTGSEPVQGVKCDVYEREFRHPGTAASDRFVIWFNPVSGLPLRINAFAKTGTGPERLAMVYDDVRINVEPPRGTFDFTPPAGYSAIHADWASQRLGDQNSASFSSGGKEAFCAVRFALNIDDRAALICWAQFNDFDRQEREGDLQGALGRRLSLTPSSFSRDRTYGNYFLRVDPGERFHWRWSLVVPEGNTRSMGPNPLVFAFNASGTPGTSTLVFVPLVFDRDLLIRMIREAQRQTLPKNAPPGAVFTIEQIEGLIDRIQQQTTGPM